MHMFYSIKRAQVDQQRMHEKKHVLDTNKASG